MPQLAVPSTVYALMMNVTASMMIAWRRRTLLRRETDDIETAELIRGPGMSPDR